MLLYLLHNNLNGKVYVGQTVRPLAMRWKWHKGDRLKPRNAIAQALRRYGVENFSVEMIRDDFQTQSELNNAEKLFIIALRSAEKRYGYNIALGGNGPGSHSAETRKKISATMRSKGVQPSVSVRTLANAARLGSCHSADAKAKMSEAGKRHTAEHMRRLQEGRMRRVLGKPALKFGGLFGPPPPAGAPQNG